MNAKFFPFGRVLLVSLGSLCLCSCASLLDPTPHGMLSGESFTESQLAADQFQVTFHGHAQTDLARAFDLALLRAAQVTKEHGFVYFAVLDAVNMSSVREYTTRRPVFVDATPTVRPLPPSATVYARSPMTGYVEVEETELFSRPNASYLIKCFAHKPAKPFTLDAAEQEQTMKQKYGIKP